MISNAIIRCMPWWRHLVSDCEVKIPDSGTVCLAAYPLRAKPGCPCPAWQVFKCIYILLCWLSGVLTAIKISIIIIIIITTSRHCTTEGREEQENGKKRGRKVGGKRIISTHNWHSGSCQQWKQHLCPATVKLFVLVINLSSSSSIYLPLTNRV